MNAILLILIILICLVLSFFVLIQNPKGGGMAGTFGGFGNSVMGAKQSSEGVEKATWYSMAALALVVLLSFVLMKKPTDSQTAGNEMGKTLKAVENNIGIPKGPAPGAKQPANLPNQGNAPKGPAGPGPDKAAE